jgi:hypothetical protein
MRSLSSPSGLRDTVLSVVLHVDVEALEVEVAGEFGSEGEPARDSRLS